MLLPQFGYEWMSSLASVLPGSGAAFLLLGGGAPDDGGVVGAALLVGRGSAAARLAAAGPHDATVSRDGHDGRGGAESVDVLVVGAGLAGLHTATLLARHGHDVLLVERRPTLTGAIRTTGIFVRKTLDDFPLPPECLGPPIRRVVLYPPGLRRPVTLVSARDEYRVGDMAPLYVAAARAAADAGVRIALGTRYDGRVGRRLPPDRSRRPDRVRARFVVGADGARSGSPATSAWTATATCWSVPRRSSPVPPSEEPPTFHCVLDPRSLPATWRGWSTTGGTPTSGWPATPSAFPTGCAGPWRGSAPRRPACRVDRPDDVERRGGPIPVGGLLRRISCADGLLVGDAAGAVSPLTAGGLDPCLRLSELAAAVLDDALRAGRAGRADPLRRRRAAAHFRAGSCCAGGWPRCARRPSRRRRSRSCARRSVRPRPAASSSADRSFPAPQIDHRVPAGSVFSRPGIRVRGQGAARAAVSRTPSARRRPAGPPRPPPPPPRTSSAGS